MKLTDPHTWTISEIRDDGSLVVQPNYHSQALEAGQAIAVVVPERDHRSGGVTHPSWTIAETAEGGWVRLQANYGTDADALPEKGQEVVVETAGMRAERQTQTVLEEREALRKALTDLDGPVVEALAKFLCGADANIHGTAPWDQQPPHGKDAWRMFVADALWRVLLAALEGEESDGA